MVYPVVPAMIQQRANVSFQHGTRRRVACAAAKSSPSVFVFGLNGYTSLALSNQLSRGGWAVSGTCRSAAAQQHLAAKGWQAFLFDPGARKPLSEDGLEHLASCSHVLSSIPPLGLPLYDPALHEQLKLLKQLPNSLKWIGYLSSTGVYGDWGGEWVDESSPCKTATGRGLVRKAAEDVWLEAHRSHGLPVHIFRLGGIYGPGRSALEAAVQGEGADPASASKQRRARQKYTSRCHVMDICQVVQASMEQPRPGAIYNVVDDDPAPRQQPAGYNSTSYPCPDGAIQVVRFARALLAGQPAPVSGAGAGASAEDQRQRTGGEGITAAPTAGLEEKRVRNALIKEELGVQLVFPTYREGLASLYSKCLDPFSASDLGAVSCKPSGGDVG